MLQFNLPHGKWNYNRLTHCGLVKPWALSRHFMLRVRGPPPFEFPKAQCKMRNYIGTSAFADVSCLTHWGRVTQICIGNSIIIASHNGLSPDRRQAIIWTSAGILLITPLGTNFREMFREMFIKILTFSLKKMFENVVCELEAICLCLIVLNGRCWSIFFI